MNAEEKETKPMENLNFQSLTWFPDSMKSTTNNTKEYVCQSINDDNNKNKRNIFELEFMKQPNLLRMKRVTHTILSDIF